MLTKSGAKLLDFGLAKTATAAVEMHAATMQKPLTQEGTILGTFQYMAPEQLEGAEADARTDIFALGTVLYEMATGRRAFDGRTKTSLIAAIVGGQPAPLREAQPLAPSALDHVISNCLEKDPERRWQSAYDVATELEWAASTTTDTAVPRRTRWYWPAAAALLALAAIAATTMYLRQRARDTGRASFSIMPPAGHTLVEAQISPDGKQISLLTSAESGEHVLWIRDVGTIAPKQVIRSATLTRGFWSPDSRSLAFFEGNRLMKIAAGDERPEVVARIDGYGYSAAWSTHGDILFTPAFGRALYRVPASGGEPVAVTKLDPARRESLHGNACWLADGRHFLYLARTIAEETNEIRAGSVDGGVKKLVAKADALVGLARGHLLLVRNGAIYAQPFDEKKLAVSGEPRRIIDDAAYYEDSAAAFATVSNDGTLVYTPASNDIVRWQLGWYDDAGHLLQKVYADTSINHMRLAHDDSKLALTKFDPRKGADDLYVYDIARGVSTRVTSGPAHAGSPVWSHDRSRVYFHSDRVGMYDVFAQGEDGSSPAEMVWKSSEDKWPTDVSPDGTQLLVQVYSAKTQADLWLVPLSGGAPRRWIASEGNDTIGSFSPDGKWVVFVSDRTGRLETYIAAFPQGRTLRVSTEGGDGAEWDHDGSRVLFAREDGMLFATPVKVNGTNAEIGTPVALFNLPAGVRTWARSRTSKRFLLRTMIDPRETVRVAYYVQGALD